MRKVIKIILVVVLLVLISGFCFFFVGKAQPAEDIKWGVVFSQKHAELMGLDWKENYLALLDDLEVKHLKLVAYWDLIEKEPGNYDFSDLDWQIQEADKRGAKILLVFGRKVSRWPECHEPDWVQNQESEIFSAQDGQGNQKLLEYIGEIINRYKNNDSIWAWQVENEPFFAFGECQLPDDEFLRKEIDLVKSLDDGNRPIVITESGEFPLWFKAARFGDIVGHTLYKKVWFHQFKRYLTYPFPPIFYARKVWLINKIFDKKVICVELQAEPWSPTLLYDSSLEEQEKTMNLERFKKIIQFARNTGEDTFYLWGAEWWYWLKKDIGNPGIWNEAKKLF